MLDDCHSILDLRDLARRQLPGPIFDVVDGAAETELTARRNTAAELCITVDTPVVGKYERDLRTGLFGARRDWPLSTVMAFARHPGWVLERLGKRAMFPTNFSGAAGKPASAGIFAEQLDASITWKDIRQMATRGVAHWSSKA